MCHYITATLPRNVNPESVAPTFEEHKLGFELISNPHVSGQIDSGDWYILTTRGHCDCGTAIGSLCHSNVGKPVSYERELNKFRKQGWSEAKIQRWVEQKEQTKERHQREDEARATGSTPELNQWVEFISELLESGKSRKLGLLLHWYQGGIESERINILGREKVKLTELNPERLMKMNEDMLYEFVAL
jgi:hypothetical protein